MANKTQKTAAEKKVKTMEIHGKYEEALSRPNTASSLDELLGENLSVYTAGSTAAYEAQLAEMNQTDLQAHAYKIGLIPIPDRKVLVGRLVGEFQKWKSQHQSSQVSVNPNSKITDKALKILREGA